MNTIKKTVSIKTGRQWWTYLWSLLGICIVSHSDLLAQTRLGLHHTQEEVDLWKKRAGLVTPTNIKYKTAGDVQTNSPGDWTRIENNAISFNSNPSTEKWEPNYNGCVGTKVGTNPNNEEPGNRGKKLRDAAFYYLLKGDTAYSNKVLAVLLAQTNVATTDFSNRTYWCYSDTIQTNPLVKAPKLNDGPPAYPICDWLTRLLFAYEDIKPTITNQNDKTKIETWFYNAALYFKDNVDLRLGIYFTDRDNGNYSLSGYSQQVLKTPGALTHFGGYQTLGIGRAYNNRRSSQVHFYTLVGIQQNNAVLKNSGKRFVKDWLKYSVYPDGTNAEYQRWENRLPDQGWSYTSFTTGQAISLADHFARIGDFELYTYSTSEGFEGYNVPAPVAGQPALVGTTGGPKTLQLTINALFNLLDGTTTKYGTDTGILYNTSASASLPANTVPYTATSAPAGSGQPNWTTNATGAAQKIIRRPNPYNAYTGWTKDIGTLYNTSSTAEDPANSVVWNATSASGGAGKPNWTTNPTGAVQKVERTPYDAEWITEYVGYTKAVKYGEPEYKIDGISTFSDLTNWRTINDIWFSMANVYYKNTYIKNVYTRVTPMPAYPATPASAGGSAYSGPWDVYPGMLFMFGQMENQVWPYPNLTLVVNAGADKVITLPTNSTTLTGSATIGAGATIASYAWTKTGGPSATLSNANTATLSLSNLVVGNYTFTLKVTDSKGSFKTDEVNVTVLEAPCTASGTIDREYWNNFNGTTIAAIPVTTTPSSTLQLTQFASPLHVADHYASRIRGYICAPQTGNYTFWVAGDDKVDLYLSTDANPANKVKIASVVSGTLSRGWQQDTVNQKSAAIALVAGKSYYIEALQIENTGGDHMAVGWKLPSTAAGDPIVVVPGTVLSPYTSSGARLSFSKESAESEIHVYPNPFEDNIAVNIGTGKSSPISITLVDGLGKVYYQASKTLSETESTVTVSGKDLKPGVYFLKLNSSSTKSKVVKIIKY